MKICNDCGLEKNLEEFYKKYKHKAWRASRCIDCLIRLRNENIDHYTIIKARSRNKPIYKKYLEFNEEFHCIKVCKKHGKLQYDQIGVHLKIEKGRRSTSLYCLKCKDVFRQAQHNEQRSAERIKNGSPIKCSTCKNILDLSFFNKGALKALYARCRECAKKHQNNYQENTTMMKRYGFVFTKKDYRKMLDEQKGVCKICHQSDKKRNLAVDHCHASMKIRGLLCKRCNLAIGQFEDSTELLKSAIEYLEKHA